MPAVLHQTSTSFPSDDNFYSNQTQRRRTLIQIGFG
jgi:hypothetical protein